MRKGDKLLIFALLVVAAALYVLFFHSPKDGGIVQVSLDGELYGEYPLVNDGEITVEHANGSNTFEIKDGTVNMVFADCRDQICVEHKTISYTGETIVCLPHKMVIEIIDGTSSPFDTVVN